jgi:hypothetical protein
MQGLTSQQTNTGEMGGQKSNTQNPFLKLTTQFQQSSIAPISFSPPNNIQNGKINSSMFANNIKTQNNTNSASTQFFAKNNNPFMSNQNVIIKIF